MRLVFSEKNDTLVGNQGAPGSHYLLPPPIATTYCQNGPTLMITQCPKCLTSFRATDAQLTIAGGSVRCGSCLHVFNAAAQTLAATVSEPASIAPTPSHHPDDGAFDRIFEGELEQRPQATDSWTPPLEPVADLDNRDAMQLDATEDNQHYIASSVSGVEDDFEFDDLAEDLSTSPVAQEYALESTQPEEIFSEGFLDLSYPPPDTAPPPSDDADDLEQETLAVAGPAVAQSEESAAQEFHFDNETMVAGERIGQPTSDYIANIEPVPVEIAQQQTRNPWISRSWLAAIVLALLTLLAQAVYFNLDTLARGDSRAALIRVCAALGCAVPSQLDVSQIHSSKLMVRSHPDTPNALVVDAIINNGAAFKQRFPDIELLFSTIDGSTVAQRVFVPAEYLHGELSGTTIMPSRQPVYIAFEIVDPGPSASNYVLSFHAN